MASVACATALVALLLARGSHSVQVIDARLDAVALVVLVAAIALGWARLVALSLLLLGAAYAIQLAFDDVAVDSSAPVVAAGLLVVAELAYWSLEERERIEAEPGAALRRVAVIAGLGVVGLFAAAVLLAVSDLVRAHGLAPDVLGAAAAAAVLATIALSARGRPHG